MADKLINKQLVDIDELLRFLSDNGFDIDDGVWNKHEMSLRKVFDEYKKNTIPDVEIGQTVWVISRDYHDIYSIKECHVHKKLLRDFYEKQYWEDRILFKRSRYSVSKWQGI